MSDDFGPAACSSCGTPGRMVWSESSAEWFFEQGDLTAWLNELVNEAREVMLSVGIPENDFCGSCGGSYDERVVGNGHEQDCELWAWMVKAHHGPGCSASAGQTEVQE